MRDVYKRMSDPEVGTSVTKTITVVTPDGRLCKRDRDGRGGMEYGTTPCNKPATFCLDYITTRSGHNRHWRNKAGWCDNHMNPKVARMFNVTMTLAGIEQ